MSHKIIRNNTSYACSRCMHPRSQIYRKRAHVAGTKILNIKCMCTHRVCAYPHIFIGFAKKSSTLLLPISYEDRHKSRQREIAHAAYTKIYSLSSSTCLYAQRNKHTHLSASEPVELVQNSKHRYF